MSTAEQPISPTSGMWAPYVPPEIGEKLDELEKVGQFVLLEAHVRPQVEVEFDGKKSMREPVDLLVATTEAGKTRLFSGFAAGIVGQAKRLSDGDLPAVCRIVKSSTGRGQTRGLELVQLIPAGADVAAIAKAQSTPLAPIQTSTVDDGIPY